MISDTAKQAILGTKLQQGNIYASSSFVVDWLTERKLPSIHEDIGVAMAAVPAGDRKGAFDVGACHGLLSVRASEMGWSPALGLEADAPSRQMFQAFIQPAHEAISLLDWKLDPLKEAHRLRFAKLAKARAVNTVLARRVLSEVFSTSYGKAGERPEVWRVAGQGFTAMLREAGIEYLVIEGRARSTRATHPIPNVDVEIEALGDGWRTSFRHKDAVVLVPSK